MAVKGIIQKALNVFKEKGTEGMVSSRHSALFYPFTGQ